MMYGGHMGGGWGFGLMTTGMVLFWALLIVGVIVLARHLGRTGRPAAPPPRPTPEQLLAERFARGEMDVDEYVERLETLLTHPHPTAT